MTNEPGLISIAIDCLKNPGRRSIWVPALQAYVCPDSKEGKQMLESVPRQTVGRGHLMDREFKLVFLTATAGTLLFTVLCVAITISSGHDIPPLWEKVATSLFDLAKIGFGAVVGLLGGQKFQAVGSSTGAAA